MLHELCDLLGMHIACYSYYTKNKKTKILLQVGYVFHTDT
jgi:hypothetical protein